MAQTGDSEPVPDQYRDPLYLTDARFNALAYQVRQTLATGAAMVVEVGIGPGLLSAILDRFGVETITVDMDAALAPNVVAALPDLPLADACADAVVSFETLEHLPLDRLGPCLAELARVSREHVLISVPRRMGILARLRRKLRRTWFAAKGAPRHHHPRGGVRSRKAPEHQWEIGHGADADTVIDAARRVGLALVRRFSPPYCEHHCFFVFRKDS